MARRAESRTFLSGDLMLEGRLDLPGEPGPVPGVVLCHPHPRYGGQMHDMVLDSLAAGLLERGIATLRFNFRGVGASEGVYDGGAGEEDDARAALATLSAEPAVDGQRLGLAGYSFGAGVAVGAAARASGIAALVLVACPPARLDTPEARALAVPKLLIAGGEDTMIPATQLHRLAETLEEPKELIVVRGADHFFGGFDQELGAPAGRFFARWLRPEPPGAEPPTE